MGQQQPGPQQPPGPYQPGVPHTPPPYQAGPYPPPYAAGPRPAPRRPPGNRWTPGLIAALLFLIAAAAAVWGSLEKIQSLDRQDRDSPDNNDGYSVTWWDLEGTGVSSDEPPYGPFGILPALAAGLLLVGAVLALTAFSTRRPGAVTGARVANALGVGLLAGAVAVQFIEALDQLSAIDREEVRPGETITFELGLGIWLPVGAVALGLIGLILVLTRARPAAVRLEPETPRMGFRAPYGPGPHQPPAPQQFHPQQPPAPTGPGHSTGPQPTQGPPTGPQPIQSPPTGPGPTTGPDEPVTRPSTPSEPTPPPPAEPDRPPEAPPERT